MSKSAAMTFLEENGVIPVLQDISERGFAAAYEKGAFIEAERE